MKYLFGLLILVIVSEVRAETLEGYMDKNHIVAPKKIEEYLEENDIVVYRAKVYSKKFFAEIAYIDKSTLEDIKKGRFDKLELRARAMFCIAGEHTGNRCLAFEVRCGNNWIRIYDNPHRQGI